MKRSEMIKIIMKSIPWSPFYRKSTVMAETILDNLEKEGMLPPLDYKWDNTHEFPRPLGASRTWQGEDND